MIQDKTKIKEYLDVLVKSGISITEYDIYCGRAGGILASLDGTNILWITNGVSWSTKPIYPSYSINERKDSALFVSCFSFTPGIAFAEVRSIESSSYEPVYEYRFLDGKQLDSTRVMKDALQFRLDLQSRFYVPIENTFQKRRVKTT